MEEKIITRSTRGMSVLYMTAVFTPLLKDVFGDCPEVVNLIVPANQLGRFRWWVRAGNGSLFEGVRVLCSCEGFQNSKILFVIDNSFRDEKVLYDYLREVDRQNASLVVVVSTYPLAMNGQDAEFLHIFTEDMDWADEKLDLVNSLLSDIKSADAAMFLACCKRNLCYVGVEAYFHTVAQFFSERNPELREVFSAGVEFLLENSKMTSDSQLAGMFVSHFCSWLKNGNCIRAFEYSDLCQIDLGIPYDLTKTIILSDDQILMREKDLADLLKSYIRASGLEAVKADLVNAGIIMSFSPTSGSFVKRFRLHFKDQDLREYFIVLSGSEIFTDDGLRLVDFIRIFVGGSDENRNI